MPNSTQNKKKYEDCSLAPITNHGRENNILSVNDDYYSWMESLYIESTDQVHIFVNINTREMDPLIEIFVWDIMLLSNPKRFIISNKRMNSEDEKLFLDYLKKMDYDQTCTHINMKNLYKTIKKLFPYSHYQFYKENQIRKALTHLYAVSFPNPKEILYKAGGLYELAFYLDLIPHNPKGSTPTKIISDENSIFPMRLLRFIDKNNLVSHLFFRDSKELVSKAFHKYHSLINENTSKAQFVYLEKLVDGDSILRKRGFSKKIWNKLASEPGELIVEEYETYYYLCEQFSTVQISTVPGLDDIEDINISLWSLLEYKKNTKIEEL